MQAPPVQYATTADGVRIAYTVSGQGPPLVFATESLVSHVQLEWSHPVFGALMRRLAERTTLVRFDARRAGLSDREVGERSATSMADLEAVVDKLGLQRFALTGVQTASIAAIQYSSRHPERVSHLVLADALVRSSDLTTTPQARAIIGALAADYILGTEAIGAAVFGVGHEGNRDYGAYVRQCVGPEFFMFAGAIPADVTDLLPTVTQPTLVLKHAGVLYVTMDASKELATSIPRAQFAVLDGGWADDIEGFADRITAFITEDAGEPAKAAHDDPSSVRTILFTDIEGHTPMMQRLGDAAGRALLREHERITRTVIARHGGSEIKTIGDAFMVSFGSVAAAAQCAVDLQRAFATSPSVEQLTIRIGLNAGEPIAEEGDLFGTSVILASRIVAQAQGGEIVVSDVVRSLLAGKNFLFHDRGETALRGFEDPVRLYDLLWRSES